MIQMIYATSLNHYIGLNGGLPWPYIQSDMAWFQRNTNEKVILMGRKTWESIGRHLPNRINVVISSKEIEGADLTVAGEPYDVIATIQSKYPGKDIIVIGGMQVYVQYVMLCDRIYSSLVQAEYNGDVKFSCRALCQQAYKLVSSSHLPESEDTPGVLYEVYDKIIQ